MLNTKKIVMDAKYEIRNVSGKGVGVFASKPIRKCKNVSILTQIKFKVENLNLSFRINDGLKVDFNKIMEYNSDVYDHAFQISPTEYIIELDGYSAVDLVNHSCEPNCGIGTKGELVYYFPIKDIEKGEELTFDYSTVSYLDNFIMPGCLCGEKTCRKTIKEFAFLPEKLQKKYLQLGAVPEWIAKEFAKNKKMDEK